MQKELVVLNDKWSNVQNNREKGERNELLILKTERKLNAEILKITLFIQEKHPELSKYLSEMPIHIPLENSSKINNETLEKYYNSLYELLKNYLIERPKKCI